MQASSSSILSHLKTVDQERAARASISGLDEKVGSIKRFQQRRFSHTYEDLLASVRYGAASRFFLNELYGPADFTQRDAQFAKVVPSLVRLFPAEIVDTVAVLAELHALSERLDSAMGREYTDEALTAEAYVSIWIRVGRAHDRASQIALTVDVAGRLDRLTRKPFLRSGLRLMRAPAIAAGLGDLQRFLEAGFDTFAAMKGAGEFIRIVREREEMLASTLFAVGEAGHDTGGSSGAFMDDAVQLLPRTDEQSSESSPAALDGDQRALQ